MSVINTNYLALVSQNNLTQSQNALGQAIERLSSGLRINSAKDDAAGQAIANRFTANIMGLTQAGRNANDGISIAQTTEGALNEINNNLQRIRVLSVQAANGSNSASDLDSIQAEIQQRLDEIDRVSAQTQFNGSRVLANDQSLSIQVGANDNETITVNLQKITSTTLKLGNFDVNNRILDTSSLSSVTLTGAAPGLTGDVVTLTGGDVTLTGGDVTLTGSDVTLTGDGVTLTGGGVTLTGGGVTLTGDSLEAIDATKTTSIGTDATKTINGFRDVSPDPTYKIYVLDSDPTQFAVSADGTDFYAATYDGSFSMEFDSDGAKVNGGDYTEATTGTMLDLGDGTFIQVDNVVGRTDSNVAGAATLHLLSDGSYRVKIGANDWAATVDIETGVIEYDTSQASATTAGLGTALTTYVTKAVDPDFSAVLGAGTDHVLYALTDGSGYILQATKAGENVYYEATVDEMTGAVSVADLGNDIIDGGVLAKIGALPAGTVGANAELIELQGGGYAVKGELNGADVYHEVTINSTTGEVTLGDAIESFSNADLSGLNAATVGANAELIELQGGGYAVKGQLDGADVYHKVTVAGDGTVTLGDEIESASNADLSGLNAATVGVNAELIELQGGGYAVKGQLDGADVYHKVTVAGDGSVTLGDEIESASNADLSGLNAATVGANAELIELQGGGYAVKGQLDGADVYHHVTVAGDGTVTLGAAIESASNADLSGLDAGVVGANATLIELQGGGYAVKGQLDGADVYHNVTVAGDGTVAVGAAIESASNADLSGLDAGVVGANATLIELQGGGYAVKGQLDGADVYHHVTVAGDGTVAVGAAIESASNADLSGLDAGVVGANATLIELQGGGYAVRGQLDGADVYHNVTVAGDGTVTDGAAIEKVSNADLSTLDPAVVGANATLIEMQGGTLAVKGQLNGADVYHEVTVAGDGTVSLGVAIESSSNADMSTLDADVVGTNARLFELQDGGYAVRGQLDGAEVYHHVTVDDTTGAVTVGDQIENASNALMSTVDTAKVGNEATIHVTADGSHVVKGTANGAAVYYAATVDSNGTVTLGEKFNSDPLASLDAALQQVDGMRSQLGAIQNRFESTIANLANTVNNLSAARSRIEDADYAVEVSNMTRAQILQQAGTSVLAQANQVPQTVLSLLR